MGKMRKKREYTSKKWKISYNDQDSQISLCTDWT